MIFTGRNEVVAKVIFFTPVCHSVQRGGCVSAPRGGLVPGGVSGPRGVSAPRGCMLGGGVWSWGVCPPQKKVSNLF